MPARDGGIRMAAITAVKWRMHACMDIRLEGVHMYTTYRCTVLGKASEPNNLWINQTVQFGVGETYTSENLHVLYVQQI